MAETNTVVLVGGGLAAGKAAETLREGGFSGRLVLIGEEPHLPYERPPLSKGFLLGNEELTEAFVHGPQWYVDNHIDTHLGTRARAVDVAAHTVSTNAGDVVYDKLLLAPGATPRRLAVADESGAAVAYLRTIEDSQRIKDRIAQGGRVAVIGGGWIGLEVAAAARSAGCEVIVVEALEKPLLRVLGPEVADVFIGLHSSHGVRLRTQATVTSVERDTDHAVVRLGDGSSVEADLIVVGVGVAPRIELARDAGLATDDGVTCDDQLRASHPDVYVAGDVATAYHPLLRRHLRVEHWDNAIGQGQTAARNMLGAAESYDRLPYFFSDQYDFGMEYVGYVGPDGYDEVVVRGDLPGRVFTAFWVKAGRVLAGMHANDWDSIDAIREIVGDGAVDLSALRDEAVPLGAIVA